MCDPCHPFAQTTSTGMFQRHLRLRAGDDFYQSELSVSPLDFSLLCKYEKKG
jgi:hypothetical protein